MLALGFLAVRYALPRPVAAFAVAPAALTVDIRSTGTLGATNKITLSTRIPGRLVDITVDRNDRVVKGQILARLDPAELTSQLTAAEASGRAAERAVGVADAERQRAMATLANASAAHDRQVSLAEKGVASQAGVDAAIASFRQAEADLTRIERTIEQARAEAQSATARIRVAEAQFEDTVVRAPFDGIVITRDRHVGDILTVGASILQLIDPATVVLTARFDESAIATINPGQSARMVFVSQPGREVTGHVLRLGRLVDEETREFSVDIALDRLPANWALGQRGTAHVSVAAMADVLTIPKSFIARRNGKAGIWVADGGRARWREIELGTSGQDQVEVRNGLRTGEIVLKSEGLYPLMKARLPRRLS
ncbi:efflux RND transporter periplasmic adaptor subunit [Bosea vaviloviae]|uniref:efflux RND transporter periplasmic adaptor subunit n=1 Tax=Bosea vaviloviae TaxID=1526658 RepID=UPI0018D139C8|nr:efflux RND transporter periplasmic adaptor subunit [Bosea vaviloviae]